MTLVICIVHKMKGKE